MILKFTYRFWFWVPIIKKPGKPFMFELEKRFPGKRFKFWMGLSF